MSSEPTTTRKAANINITRDFVLAGEAVFTVSNGNGQHYTYKVFRPKPTDKFPNPHYFIQLKTGGTTKVGEEEFAYIGGLDRIGPRNRVTIRMTAKSAYPIGSLVVVVAKWALRVVWQVSAGVYTLPDPFTIRHTDKCGRCGKPLTNPTSLDTGLGEECAAALGVEWAERDRGPAPNTKPAQQGLKWDLDTAPKVDICERCGKRPSVGIVPVCSECAQLDPDYATGAAAHIDPTDTSHPGHPSNYGDS